MTIELLLISIILAAIAAEAITNHVVKNDVFYYPRLFLVKLPFVGKLITCPVCFSQWASWLTTAAFMICFGAEITSVNIVTWFFSSFITYRMSNVFHDVTDLLLAKTIEAKVP